MIASFPKPESCSKLFQHVCQDLGTFGPKPMRAAGRKGGHMIEACSFGSMVIDGKRYSSDLIIYPDGRVADSWRRKEGHRLYLQDITSLITTKPEIIVAGTGVSGRMRPDRQLAKLLAAREISFVAEANQTAVQRYNAMATTKKVGACFHLTC